MLSRLAKLISERTIGADSVSEIRQRGRDLTEAIELVAEAKQLVPWQLALAFQEIQLQRDLAMWYLYTGQTESAAGVLEGLLPQTELLVKQFPNRSLLAANLGAVLLELASLRLDEERYRDSVSLADRAIRLLEPIFRSSQSNSDVGYYLLRAHITGSLAVLNDPDSDSRVIAKRAFDTQAIGDEVAEAFPADESIAEEVEALTELILVAYQITGKWGDAITLVQSRLSELSSIGPVDVQTRFEKAQLLTTLAELERLRDRKTVGERHLREAWSLLKTLAPGSAIWKQISVYMYMQLATR